MATILTKEMMDHFKNRTEKHIEFVKKWYSKLAMEYYSIPLIEIDEHDSSKFESPEYIPYISLTWNYYCKDHRIKFNISDELQKSINEATMHHIRNNAHHPEFWDNNFDSSKFNSRNKDEPSKNMIDATSMPLNFILEMLADWFAMSDEKGTDPTDWAEKNINIRWKFTPEQINLIESGIVFYDEQKKIENDIIR